MTELQIGLIGLGAVAVAGVLGYNKWQEMRHRKAAEAAIRPQHDDVLLGGGSPAPARDDDETPPAASESDTVERREPVFESQAFESPAAVAEPAEEAAPAMAPAVTSNRRAVVEDAPEDAPLSEVPVEFLDPRLEFIIGMELVDPAPASQLLALQREALQRVHKPLHWFGFSDRGREWLRLTADDDTSIRRLRVGLQLVNRLGPVSEADLAAFTSAMRALADELMAVADVPATRTLDQAAEIDRFCAAVDLEIGINLVSRGNVFSGTKIRALAEAAGMTLGTDGLFTRYDDEGRAQFSLQNYESTRFSPENVRTLSTHGLTFLLDVPRVDHGERVFMQMTELARRFADTLQGVLVDDNRQPLGEPQIEHIRREFIGKPQATMAGFGLPAGSPQALRLFS